MGDLLDSGYEWSEGVNPNIELFSGKVLDEKNETTVDRVVEGIEWAIENETDILSLIHSIITCLFCKHLGFLWH